MKMTPRERVLAALNLQEPDRVPYCESSIDLELAEKLMGWHRVQRGVVGESAYTPAETLALADFLGLDNITFRLRAPTFAHTYIGTEGREFPRDGMIKSEADLSLIKLPNPKEDALYAGAEEFIRHKGQYAACFSTRIGLFQTVLSMGIQGFSLSLYDNPSLVETILDLYFDWMVIVAERVCQLGFDIFWTTDDFAFKTAPFFSPAVFHKMILPRYRRVAQKVSVPWLIHSDGNVTSYLEDLLSLGIAGLHPIEKGAMDIREMKRKYGDKLCLLGNVDLDLLGRGTPEEVDQEVHDLIRDIAPGGGYIVTSGNSLASFLKPENVVALTQAVKKYGSYPISL